MLRRLLLLLCVLGLFAPAAYAQEDEVFVDPDSPSGKEYALPVESAREQASRDARRRSSSDEPAPLFGEGIGDDSATGASVRSGATGGGDEGGEGSDGAASAGRMGSGRSPDPAADGGASLGAQTPTPDGGAATAAIVGGGAGVLLLGGAAGLLLRRRSLRAG